MTPHLLIATVNVSRQSLIETGGFSGVVVNRTINDQYAERIISDTLFAAGGANEVTGVDSVSGINTQTVAKLSEWNFADTVSMRTPIVSAKIPRNSYAYVMGTELYTKLLTTQRSTGGGDGLRNRERRSQRAGDSGPRDRVEQGSALRARIRLPCELERGHRRILERHGDGDG